MTKSVQRFAADRRATVTDRWFGGCAGSKVCRAPNDEPATVLYAPRAAWFVIRTIRAFATTHTCPDPQPAVRCSARARRRPEPRLSGRVRRPAEVGSGGIMYVPKPGRRSVHQVRWLRLVMAEVKSVVIRGGPTCLVISHTSPQRHGAPLSALTSIPLAPTTDRGCFLAPERRTNSSCYLACIIIDSTSVNGRELRSA